MAQLPGTSPSLTDVSFDLPSLEEVIKVLLLQAGFNSAQVVIGALLLGITAGVVGAFAILRKRALMGDALAHSALPGLAGAFIIAVSLGFEGRTLPVLLSGATISGVMGILCIQGLRRYTRISEDSALGAVLSVFFGAGVVLLSVIQSMETGSAGGLNHFIYGQTAAMRSSDALFLVSLAGVALLSVTLLLKEFALVCFDREFAIQQGWPVGLIDFLMMTLVTITTVVGLQSVGMLLIVALLIVPAAAARFWTENLSHMVIISAFIGAVSGYLGAASSALLPRFPAGAVIVLTAGTAFVVSFLFAPRRGIIAGSIRLLALRTRVLKEHFLREVFELCETRGGDFTGALALHEVRLLRGMRPLMRRTLIRLMAWVGLIKLSPTGFSLTQKGFLDAQKLTRSHRLWELYLRQHAELPLSHLDYSADLAEHVLSPEIIKQLEYRLSHDTLEPPGQNTPQSPHPISHQVQQQ